MSVADVVAVVLFAAVVAYAVFGGADFGSGVWDLTAGNDRSGAPTRRLIDHAIGPVWEANHVWLIFVLVLLWTGFPGPFTQIMQSLAVPFWLAGLGIVARGAAFAFRKFAPSLGWARTTGAIFALASLATPALLGAIAGAIASGRAGADASGAVGTWTGPTSILGAVLAVATCTFIAGVFLTAEAAAIGDTGLAGRLRHRSLIGGVLTGGVAIIGIPVILSDAPTLADGLTGRASPVIALSAVAGLTTLWLLWRGHLRSARLSATVAVAAVVVGWGVAQYPWLIVDHVTIDDGAGSRAALTALAIAAGAAVVLVVPALVWLFRLADTNQIGAEANPTSPRSHRPTGD